jgi:hypothetical protein
MLAAHPNTFLRIRHPPGNRGACAKKNILEGIHSRIGEQQGGICRQDDRGTGNYFVTLAFKEIKEGLTYF